MTYQLKKTTLDTILAALRYWQREGLRSDQCIEHDIATDGGEHPEVDSAEIDRICQTLNGGDGRQVAPVVV